MKKEKNIPIQEIMDKTEELIQLILSSEEYLHYQNDYNELKKSKDLYEKMNDFRRKNLEIQIFGEEASCYNEMQKLYSESRDVLVDPLVSHFMMSEQIMCKLIRKVQDHISEGCGLDISYMEDIEEA